MVATINRTLGFSEQDNAIKLDTATKTKPLPISYNKNQTKQTRELQNIENRGKECNVERRLLHRRLAQAPIKKSEEHNNDGGCPRTFGPSYFTVATKMCSKTRPHNIILMIL